MNGIRNLIRDLGKALLFGTAAALAAAVFLFLAGFAVGKGNPVSGLETAKNGSFLIASLLLFLLAGMLMIKGKKPDRVREREGWRAHFCVIGMKTVTGVAALAFLTAGAAIDLIQFRM